MFQKTSVFEKLNYLAGITRISVTFEMEVGDSYLQYQYSDVAN